MIGVVFRAAYLARRGRYGDQGWIDSSIDIMNALEHAGCRLHIEGMEVLHMLDSAAVFVGNHMSTLETFALPGLINPVRRCTFVIKPSLMEYPVFKHVMRSRNPIVVSRDNPRQDLVTVLEEGAKRLAQGTSIILFPQTTRTPQFDPAQFNSLGVKVAKKAGVPVVPVALKTDAWENGNMLKDFGAIVPERSVHIRFGSPLTVDANGRAQQEAVVAFIQDNLRRWNAPSP
ncbi:MAG: 1-acyl-sn-glycerol-3-phosphate acyltransferase [Bacteroidetes bacterium]|nr:1-acyl-sn-glycerol-3-phosphate acyltransferase [Bacteroidota bacterium]